MPRARTAGDERRWRQLLAGEKKAREQCGWRAASWGKRNGLTEAEKTATLNQRGKWMKEEEEEERQKLRQEGAQRKQVVGHAMEECASWLLGSEENK